LHHRSLFLTSFTRRRLRSAETPKATFRPTGVW
jgi:hypothetical protein